MTPYHITDADYKAIVKAARDPKADWREDLSDSTIERLTLELDTPRVTIGLEREVSTEQDWTGDRYVDVVGERYEITSVEAFDKDDNDIPHDFDNSRLVGLLNWGRGARRAA